MSSDPPPARDEQLGARFGLHVFEMRNTGILGVDAEPVLLVVRRAEDVVADGENADHARGTSGAEGQGIDGQIARLPGIDKRLPDGRGVDEHKAKPVGHDIHGCQDGRFHPEGVEHIHGLESGDEDDAVRDSPVGLVLVCTEGEVVKDPCHKTCA